MKTPPTHIVHQHDLLVSVTSQDLAAALQSQLPRLYHQQVLAVMDRAFSAVCPPNWTVRIEELELDLGEIAAEELENDFPEKLYQQLVQALQRLIEAQEGTGTDSPNAADASPGGWGKKPKGRVVVAKELSDAATLAHFLQTGTLPWHIPTEEQATFRADRLAKSLLSAQPATLAEILAPILGQKAVKDRLFALFNPIEQKRFLRFWWRPADFAPIEAAFHALKERSEELPASPVRSLLGAARQALTFWEVSLRAGAYLKAHSGGDVLATWATTWCQYASEQTQLPLSDVRAWLGEGLTAFPRLPKALADLKKALAPPDARHDEAQPVTPSPRRPWQRFQVAKNISFPYSEEKEIFSYQIDHQTDTIKIQVKDFVFFWKNQDQKAGVLRHTDAKQLEKLVRNLLPRHQVRWILKGVQALEKLHKSGWVNTEPTAEAFRKRLWELTLDAYTDLHPHFTAQRWEASVLAQLEQAYHIAPEKLLALLGRAHLIPPSRKESVPKPPPAPLFAAAPTTPTSPPKDAQAHYHSLLQQLREALAEKPVDRARVSALSERLLTDAHQPYHVRYLPLLPLAEQKAWRRLVPPAVSLQLGKWFKKRQPVGHEGAKRTASWKKGEGLPAALREKWEPIVAGLATGHWPVPKRVVETHLFEVVAFAPDWVRASIEATWLQPGWASGMGGKAVVALARTLPEAVAWEILSTALPQPVRVQLLGLFDLFAQALARSPINRTGFYSSAIFRWSFALELAAAPKRDLLADSVHFWVAYLAKKAGMPAQTAQQSLFPLLLDTARQRDGHLAKRLANWLLKQPETHAQVREVATPVRPVVRWRANPSDPIAVGNAGLVLLHPFVTRLFSRLNYLENNQFRDEATQHRAAVVLQYLVDKCEVAQPEQEQRFTLNKLFCGIPLETPMLPSDPLTEEEKEVGESLLQAVIQNWKVLQKTSVTNFRVSFLQREGELLADGKNWKVKVAPKTFDVLVDRLPWSLSMIKFPWAPYFFHTEWR